LIELDNIITNLAEQNYIADRALATSIYLAIKLNKPLLLEGMPGIGKTSLASALATMRDCELIRLQCFEGIDSQSALYEWNYPRQLLAIKSSEKNSRHDSASLDDIFTMDYLLPRPLLKALQSRASNSPILLIDEIDRADEEFEAFLLEALSDYQISIPEIGTIKATSKPIVLLTSNGTRELHGALKRRCLYHWIDYPDPHSEFEIIQANLPEINVALAQQVCDFVNLMRSQKFSKKPGIAESIDWAQALIALGVEELNNEIIQVTAGCLLKYKKDLDIFDPGILAQLNGNAVPGHSHK
jgi:MoxR-like ATPase